MCYYGYNSNFLNTNIYYNKKWGYYLKTEIAKDIDYAGAMIQYDAQCKKVLSNKYVLSWIMQGTMEEYFNLSRDIIYQCIEKVWRYQESILYLDMQQCTSICWKCIGCL